jgi:hypothetical protein
MLLTILVIAGFQAYWLRDNYHREKQNLEIKTNSAFRQTILRLQASKLRLESGNIRMDSSGPIIAHATPSRVRVSTSATSSTSIARDKVRDFNDGEPVAGKDPGNRTAGQH